MSLLLLFKQSGPVNTPPIASFTVNPNPATSLTEVLTLASTSTDPDGTIVAYQWELVSAPSGWTGTFSAPTASTTTFTPSNEVNDNTLPTSLPFTLG